MTKLDKALSLSLMVAIVAAIGYLGYVIASPKPGQEFTEFYVLDVEGKARDYPQQIVLGEPVEVIIGIVNHE